MTLIGIGAVYSDMGDSRRALDYLDKALSLERAVGNFDGEAVALNMLGTVHEKLGERNRG
jgi:hypothetical protein